MEGCLHLAEQGTALQDLLLQSLEVVDVAHRVAAVTVGEGTVWNLALRGRGCWEGRQEQGQERSKTVELVSNIWR